MGGADRILKRGPGIIFRASALQMFQMLLMLFSASVESVYIIGGGTRSARSGWSNSYIQRISCSFQLFNNVITTFFNALYEWLVQKSVNVTG